ncbi:uncharacterized protein TRAVEDRAFT_118360 [Trametes versicolor FP-101664 SS1]|uniref:uncharacterized protein n=1 Tax=Trametes versicolor (strain FP-101664) TaxID=717944 RepID=UPI000462483B|nr:uncharacterized protein TRAVEDRAFT_118360 [Trametes versicolor FP-101664 SS1]EIW60008.1 hypothetical protein TRAVEDRAFT_118360 [Trametes versicolor FP-101664 SS1]
MPPALRPAHETKHIPVLIYPFRTQQFHLAQLDNGATNGSALWLGAQCLSLFFSDNLKRRPSPSGHPDAAFRPRAIELGSGIGLSALALASMGWDVIATDLHDVVSSVLADNISSNLSRLPVDSGTVQVRILDWTVPPDRWLWDDPQTIASSEAEKPQSAVPQAPVLGPPFDLILTSDTIYSPDLVTPLLRALHGLCLASASELRTTPVYLCLERRDPALVDHALSEARDSWNFKVERIPHKKLAKALEKSGAHWEKGDWEGVEIWKLALRS